MRNMQVAVIGNASVNNNVLRNIAQKTGKVIANTNYHLVCGGLQGIMLEACRGFKQTSSKTKTIGILPTYDQSSANEFIDIIIPTGLDVGRNQLVVASGFAVVVIGGGAGTLSEMAIASQISKPIILMKGSGGWADKISEEYLDERRNSRLYHVYDHLELQRTLLSLEELPDKSNSVNSGHNR